ncbi:MAG TPA: glycosyltransferase 87 family protein, partial [Candidatus Baltobacteraceae bacterium]|nr:glycosyltransferase 87 family protein [Candidatus Baltobacteraceae bacterium]
MIRVTLAAIAAAFIAIAFGAFRAPSEPGVFMRDFEAYYSAGRAFDAGADAYSPQLLTFERAVPGVDAHRQELLPFIGAPPTLPFWGLLARFDYVTSARIWMVCLSASLALLLACTAGLCGVRALSLDGAILVLCALAFVPVTSDFVLGQPALVAYAAAAVAVFASARSVPVTALAAVVGSLQPNVALASVVAAGRRRGLAAFLLAAGGLYAIGAIAAGWAWPVAYFSALRAHGAAERFDVIQYAVPAISFGFGASQGQAAAVAAVIALAVLAVAVVAIFRTRDTMQRFVIACAALPLLTGFVHEHDLVLLFIPALWAMRTADARRAPLAVLAFGFAAVNSMDFAQQPGAAWQDLVLCAGALAAVLAWSPQQTPRHYAAAGCALAVAAACAWIGTHHPAPIWPNDMSAFHISPGASSADMWRAEQLHTGLIRKEPAWALLRSIPLAGSIVLLLISA